MDIIPLLTSGAGAAIAAGIFKLLESGLLRRNKRCGETRDEMARVVRLVETLAKANRVLLHERIKYNARCYLQTGFVGFDDMKDIIDMYDTYHDGLGGNGHLEHLMEAFKKLPMFKEEKL